MSFDSTSFSLGKYKITSICDGSQWFDGGAMFHIIPKSFWEKKVYCDEQNRIEVSLNSLLIQELEENGNITKNILIEAGAGNKFSEKKQEIFKRDTKRYLIDNLQRVGIGSEDIDAVVLTHLHKDHAGSLTYIDDENALQCSFPNATHYALQEELDFALGGNELSRVSFNSDDFTPVIEAGLFEFIRDEKKEIFSGIEYIKTGGHTKGHAYIHITQGNQHLICPGDIIPTCNHIALTWDCSYDYWSYEVTEQKKQLLALAHKLDAIVYLVHEIETPFVKIVKNGNEFSYTPIDL